MEIKSNYSNSEILMGQLSELKNHCDGISLSAGEAEGSGDFADGIAELLDCIETTRVCLSELIENTCRFLGNYTETMKETDCMAAGTVTKEE